MDRDSGAGKCCAMSKGVGWAVGCPAGRGDNPIFGLWWGTGAHFHGTLCTEQAEGRSTATTVMLGACPCCGTSAGAEPNSSVPVEAGLVRLQASPSGAPAQS